MDAAAPSAMIRPSAQASVEPKKSRHTSKPWIKSEPTRPQPDEKPGLPGSKANRASVTRSQLEATRSPFSVALNPRRGPHPMTYPSPSQ
jgi:hypothetical protein